MDSIKYQFQQGTSGNPKGRPKVNDKSLSRAVLKDRLAAYKFVQQAMKNQEPGRMSYILKLCYLLLENLLTITTKYRSYIWKTQLKLPVKAKKIRH